MTPPNQLYIYPYFLNPPAVPVRSALLLPPIKLI